MSAERQPDFLVLCGLSGSGKSTLGKRLADLGWHHEEYDKAFEGDEVGLTLAIQTEIDRRLEDMYEARAFYSEAQRERATIEALIHLYLKKMAVRMIFMLRMGIRTVFDFQAIEPVSRKALLVALRQQIEGSKMPEVTLGWLDTPPEICVQRFLVEDGYDPGLRISAEAVQAAGGMLKPPQDDEGFSQIVRISHRDDALAQLDRAEVDVSDSHERIEKLRMTLAVLTGRRPTI